MGEGAVGPPLLFKALPTHVLVLISGLSRLKCVLSATDS